MGFWDDSEIIYSYTREEALEDSVLVDVSEMAQEAGFKVPVALTASVWSDVNKQGDPDGRLWDLLWMAFFTIRTSPGAPGGSEVVYKLHMPVGRKKLYYAKVHVGPGDQGNPVATILTPQED